MGEKEDPAKKTGRSQERNRLRKRTPKITSEEEGRSGRRGERQEEREEA